MRVAHVLRSGLTESSDPSDGFLASYPSLVVPVMSQKKRLRVAIVGD